MEMICLVHAVPPVHDLQILWEQDTSDDMPKANTTHVSASSKGEHYVLQSMTISVRDLNWFSTQWFSRIK